MHNYDEFITSFLAMLLEQNMLGDLVQQSLGKAEKKEDNKMKEGKNKKHVGKVISKHKTQYKKKKVNSDSDLSDASDSRRNNVKLKTKKKKWQIYISTLYSVKQVNMFWNKLYQKEEWRQ